ncbi:MAG TPA: hypothetical protein VJ725_26950 [Thermoanaerobaculia bacterium]|nr:hypothetical protein [Thermoanaerobaculia bacterium]
MAILAASRISLAIGLACLAASIVGGDALSVSEGRGHLAEVFRDVGAQ